MNLQAQTGTSERVPRPWGWFENICERPGFKVKRIGISPGRQLSLQRHRQRAEHWVVVTGTAWATVGEQAFELQVGQHADIALGQVHRLANRTALELEVVEVQFGLVLDEDDIERLQDDYGRLASA